jgi:RNA polymerase sigma factor (sigma-70 family)
VSVAAFTEALERSVSHWSAGRTPSAAECERYLMALHLEDLALACACGLGLETAWDYFVLEYRPGLYRAADALDRSGGARELADALYGELFGLNDAQGARRTLFRYFHGRSSLATWLRAVLTQRRIDHLRAHGRFEALPADDAASSPVSPAAPDADRQRFLTTIATALSAALAALVARDRLRLGCYYAQQMTLAQIGKLMHEHEGTVSRHLTRTRRAIRDDVEARLRQRGLGDREIEECFVSVMEDAGPLDLVELLDVGGERKKTRAERSTDEGKP